MLGRNVANCIPKRRGPCGSRAMSTVLGIGPIYAVPKPLKRFGLKVDDTGLWELSEAFAAQAVYCQDKIGIPNELLNVSGGAISIGHPYGMSRARMAGQAYRRHAPRRQTCGRDHVHRWRDGCGRPVRSAVTGEESEQRREAALPRFIRPGPAPDRR